MGGKDLWRGWFGGRAEAVAEQPAQPAQAPQPADEPLPRISAADNPWGVELVDLRPVTQTLVSTTTDQQMAVNAVAMAREDGRCFAGQAPDPDRTVPASVGCYLRIDEVS